MRPLRCLRGGGSQLISRLVESSPLLRMFSGAALGSIRFQNSNSRLLVCRDRTPFKQLRGVDGGLTGGTRSNHCVNGAQSKHFGMILAT